MLVCLTVLPSINWISEGCFRFDSAVFGQKEVRAVVGEHLR